MEDRALTEEGSADLSGGGLPHLKRGLLTVPGCVWGADQIGGILQWPLCETAEVDHRQEE